MRIKQLIGIAIVGAILIVFILSVVALVRDIGALKVLALIAISGMIGLFLSIGITLMTK